MFLTDEIQKREKKVPVHLLIKKEKVPNIILKYFAFLKIGLVTLIEDNPERETASVYTGSSTFRKEDRRITVFSNKVVIAVKLVKIIENVMRYVTKNPLSDTPYG